LAFAEDRGYPVLEPPPDGILDSVAIISPKGTKCIFQRQVGKTEAEINHGLSHELGHCEEDAFYTELTSPAGRMRAEGLAKRWSYRRMVPVSAFVDAIQRRETEPWQIAEKLCVPVQMVLEAAEYYRAALTERFPS
jgi:hypothetical protein